MTEARVDLPTTILVPTDFSSHAQTAQRYAVQLAKKLSAGICLLHVWQLPLVNWRGESVGITEELFLALEAKHRAALEAAVARAREDLPGVESRLLQGDARDLIVQVARQLPAGLIVMGTRGHRGVARLLLGSVAEYVVRHAPCPVLTLGAQEEP
jgi:nucleotide-binding universal stress UspA family protein